VFPRIGFHFSMAKGVSEAVRKAQELGCTAMQIFPGNPRGWVQKPMDPGDAAESKNLRNQFNLRPLVVHLPYLANLASPDRYLYKKSSDMLLNAMDKCTLLDADFLNIHVGSSRSGTRQEALARIADALNRALKKFDSGSRTIILLENTAGGGSELGGTFEDLRDIIRLIRRRDRIGVCLDTAHLFGKGFDLRNESSAGKVLREFDNIVGRPFLKLIHFNDSKAALGSKNDRHQHIGRGLIGDRGMKAVIRLAVSRRLPLIMETPYVKTGDDRNNLKKALSYLGLKKIRS
jgi:deoxyribonuclease IV